MSSPIPYEFDDHDVVSPGYSVALLARHPTAMLGRQLAPVDAGDCAPGLETQGSGYEFVAMLLASVQVKRGGAFATRWQKELLARKVDCDHDRPSPGDDVRLILAFGPGPIEAR